MASVRAGRDARGAMNDLPIPGQPDFDMNTMKLASPTPQPNVPPAPLPPDMTQFAPIPTAQPYHSMNIPPPPDPVDAKINKLMAAAPTSSTPSGPDMGPPRGGVSPPPLLRPGSDTSVDASGGGGAGAGGGGPSIIDVITNRAGADKVPQTGGGGPGGVESSAENLVRNQNPHPFDWKALAAAGVPLAVIAMIARSFLSKGRGGSNPGELEKVMQLGAPEVKPAIEDFRPRHYGDDTIAPATDEARARVNEAYGGDDTATIQGKQDTAMRQNDINSGKIKPQDYAEGEKPKPGTPGYKQWFKYRQDLSKNRGAGDTGASTSYGNTTGNLDSEGNPTITTTAKKKGGPKKVAQ